MMLDSTSKIIMSSNLLHVPRCSQKCNGLCDLENKIEAQLHARVKTTRAVLKSQETTIRDSDDLDYLTVVVNPYDEKISIRMLGSSYHDNPITGYAWDNALGFANQSDFKSYSPGDIVSILESENTKAIGHYTVESVTNSFLILDRPIITPIDWSAKGVKVKFGVSKSSENKDGVSLQALYSYLREEWRDSDVNRGEDLMQFTFPLTAITREQMILGGVNCDASSAWSFAENNGSKLCPRKLIRYGGWTEKGNDGHILAEYTGIITLGSICADTQVCYQQYESGPVIPFSRTGSVNEAIKVENEGYIKISICERESRVWSDLMDICATRLEPMAVRFPLSERGPTRQHDDR